MISYIEEIKELQLFIEEKAAELKKVLKLKAVPEIEIGKQCDNPYPCDFYGYCSKDLEEEEPDYGKKFIDKKAIREFTNGLKYLLYFMDFETWMTAIPEQDGHWPYRQVNFQFSVHVQNGPDEPLKHHYYLAEGTHSAQKDFIEELLKVLGTKGSIVVYNQTFENSRLNELKAEFPKLEKTISSVQDRIVDLMVPFRKNYRLPEMQGSYSLKYVLPAIAPEMKYGGLSINNGGDASAAFYNLKFEMDAEKRINVRNSLLEYCGLDTLGMVRLLEKLKEI